MEKINVLHLIKTLNMGGAEKNLYNLVGSLDRERLNIRVGYSYGGEFEEKFRNLGVPLFKFSETEDKIRSFETFPIILRLVKYILEEKIQIVHTHTFNTHVWGAIAAKLAGAKLVEHVHDARYEDPGDYARGRGSVTQYKYIKYIKHSSDCVVVLTEKNYRFLLQKRHYRENRILKIPNGIPLNGTAISSEKVTTLKRNFGLHDYNQVVLTSLRFSPEKNVDLIFRIAPIVASAVPGAVFLISGEGPLFDEFRAESKKLRPCCIKLIGYYSEIRDLLAICDIFLLPSLLEFHSIAILEALSMKVPVVTSQGVGCNDEFITSWQNGVLLNPFCDAGWAEAIIRLLREPELRRQIGQRGYETCLSRFNTGKVAKEFEDLYNELVRE